MGWRMEHAKPIDDARQVFAGAVSAVLGPVEAGLDEVCTIDEALDDWDRKRAVASALLSRLTPREERVIRLRYGFAGDECTLGEIGRDLGVSKDRIRQIEAKALRKLKSPRVSKMLRVFRTGITLPPPPARRYVRAERVATPKQYLISINGEQVPVFVTRWICGDERHERATGMPGPYALFDHAGQEWLAAQQELTEVK